MDVEPALIFVLAAVAVVVVVRWVAGRTGLPAAALLPVIGIGYAVLPGPNIPLDPDLVLAFVLPPLLYSAALDSSMIAISRNLRTVVSLSVLLVLLTALLIGLGFAWFVTGATLAAGIAVGAAVAPPDPVAALAVGRKVGLPPRIITLIQGEGLLNDATALTILSVAVAAATGDRFSAPAALGRFLLAAAGGVAVGALTAFAVRLLSRPLSGDPIMANAVSLATPFCAYLLGEVIHVSGVLAVVVAGLIVGHHTPRSASGAGRLQTNAVWRLVDFLLEGFVFLLIGQQLPAIIRGLAGYDTATVVVAVSIAVGVTLLLRPLWLILTLLVPAALHTRWSGDSTAGTTSARWTAREVAVLSWAGTRGVISLAAIFTLPLVTEAGADFPARDLLLFCTVVVVLVTLVGQGLTFAPMVRTLGLRADDNDQALLRNQARAASVEAALTALDELQEQHHDDIGDEMIETMREQLRARLSRYRDRLSLLRDNDSADVPISPQYEAALHVRRVAIDAQREEFLRWRDAGRLPDAGLRVLERELDLEERLLPDRPARR
ncbi:CPA1 family monovalent cation:H+ antiporter [Actinoplanes octamycinicus]|uniref:CPA1 family monovalent cation:H+ antiporter n=1 Tax=Actinoplanes octamycinicus TaxID=135948 RepID=A0A7W7M9S9_9ACTN|nr:Na+/H+ antiporter [Actinoplanes octamycinicus]MBB4742186.1 CPA1 family monovalent cation:H+ antiporter [Actinoplanes octamycinicus]GIE59968.1 putative Na+/H+ antiporter [Actinoplanes octamycinicus]